MAEDEVSITVAVLVRQLILPIDPTAEIGFNSLFYCNCIFNGIF